VIPSPLAIEFRGRGASREGCEIALAVDTWGCETGDWDQAGLTEARSTGFSAFLSIKPFIFF
jgi:hypothetical protein